MYFRGNQDPILIWPPLLRVWVEVERIFEAKRRFFETFLLANPNFGISTSRKAIVMDDSFLENSFHAHSKTPSSITISFVPGTFLGRAGRLTRFLGAVSERSGFRLVESLMADSEMEAMTQGETGGEVKQRKDVS